jgi:hypothetical protein
LADAEAKSKLLGPFARATVAAELGIMFMGATLPTSLYSLDRQAFAFSGITLTLVCADSSNDEPARNGCLQSERSGQRARHQSDNAKTEHQTLQDTTIGAPKRTNALSQNQSNSTLILLIAEY